MRRRKDRRAPEPEPESELEEWEQEWRVQPHPDRARANQSLKQRVEAMYRLQETRPFHSQQWQHELTNKEWEQIDWFYQPDRKKGVPKLVPCFLSSVF